MQCGDSNSCINVGCYLAAVLPVMLSSKLLPEMETEDNTKREQLLHGMQGLPVAAQIDKLKVCSHTTGIYMYVTGCSFNDVCVIDCRPELI